MGQKRKNSGSPGLGNESDIARQVQTAVEAYGEYLGHKDPKMRSALSIAMGDMIIKRIESAQGSLNSNFPLVKDDLKVIVAELKVIVAELKVIVAELKCSKEREEETISCQKLTLMALLAIIRAIKGVEVVPDDSKAEVEASGAGSGETGKAVDDQPANEKWDDNEPANEKRDNDHSNTTIWDDYDWGV